MSSSSTEQSSQPEARSQPGSNLWFRIGVAGLFVGGIFLLTWLFGPQRILNYLSGWEARAESFRYHHPVAVYAVAFLLYVGVTGLSLPGATAMTILYGWFFEFLPAVILISFASTTGATLAFLMSRYFLRETIQQRFGHRLESVNGALEREGATYLFTLRLIPAVPFFVLNLVMGLTPIRTRTYWWVSQLGMLPATAVYTYAGNSFPEISAIQSVVERYGVSGLLTHSGSEINLSNLFLALTLLALFPVALKFVIKKFKKTRPDAARSDSSSQS
jgi:uncharacterized membrane protein YdjX (TVP38/TMEM64 family)